MVSPCFVVNHHKMSIDIGGMRKPYYDEQHCFEIKDLTGLEPLAQFKAWFDEASSNSHIGEFSYLFHLYLLRLRFTIREARISGLFCYPDVAGWISDYRKDWISGKLESQGLKN